MIEFQTASDSVLQPVLQTESGPVSTTKRLYWRRAPDKQWQILSEESG